MSTPLRKHPIEDHPPTDYKLARIHCKRGTSTQQWESSVLKTYSTLVFTCAHEDVGPNAVADGLTFDPDLSAWCTNLAHPNLMKQLRKWGVRPPCTRTVLELNAAYVQLFPRFNPVEPSGRDASFYCTLLRQAPFGFHVSSSLEQDTYNVHVRSLYRQLHYVMGMRSGLVHFDGQVQFASATLRPSTSSPTDCDEAAATATRASSERRDRGRLVEVEDQNILIDVLRHQKSELALSLEHADKSIEDLRAACAQHRARNEELTSMLAQCLQFARKTSEGLESDGEPDELLLSTAVDR